jgi:hypothetical protein
MITQLLTASLALVLVVLLFVIAHRSPRLAVVTALLALCFIPVWIGVGIGFNGNLFVPLGTLAALACGLALLPLRGFRFSLVDALLLFLVTLAASSLLTSDLSLALSFLVTPFAYFVAGYALGRIASARVGLEFVYAAIAVIVTGVAVLAIIEFATGWNPFVQWRVGNSLFVAWGELQERGGRLRAEGAFGHSIALGATLALAVPITLASRFSFVARLCMTALLCVATVFTFSRIGIVCAFLGLALCAVFLRDRLAPRERAILLGGGAIVALALLPLVSTVFGEAGDEASNSADYRGDLVPLLEHANLVGFSDLVHYSATGALSFGDFQSIDSQLILTGLTNGSLALVAAAIALVGAVVLVLRGRAEPATIAVVAQIPALATVALITQYSITLWLVVGLAATSQLSRVPAAVAQPLRLPEFARHPSLARPTPPGD